MSSLEKQREMNMGRLTKVSHLGIPRVVARSPRYLSLSGNAMKLLVEFAFQFNGFNNGLLAVPWSRMKRRGWRSEGTLWRALAELLASRMIVMTRQGGLHSCSLFAVSWEPIADKPKKGVDGTSLPPGGWNDPITEDDIPKGAKTFRQKMKRP